MTDHPANQPLTAGDRLRFVGIYALIWTPYICVLATMFTLAFRGDLLFAVLVPPLIASAMVGENVTESFRSRLGEFRS